MRPIDWSEQHRRELLPPKIFLQGADFSVAPKRDHKNKGSMVEFWFDFLIIALML
jgi:hypothetical protein